MGFLAVAVILVVRIAGTAEGRFTAPEKDRQDCAKHQSELRESSWCRGSAAQTQSAQRTRSDLALGVLSASAVKSSSSGTAAGAVRPLKVGDAIPDATLTDQDSRAFRLADLKGKPFVLTFIYTECNMPTMCPGTTEKLVKVRDLSRAHGQGDAQIVIVSFDPERDKPSRLKQFAKGYTTDFSGFRLATGAEGEIASLARLLNTYYSKSQPGVFAHNIVVSIVDRTGALRDQFFGNTWEPREVALALEKLSL